MKTLLDEWFDGKYSIPEGRIEHGHTVNLLDKYGDWRVQSGFLGTREGKVVLQDDVTEEPPRVVGALGHIVTLILPPEEKEETDWEKLGMEMERQAKQRGKEARAERARADKYEKALKAIRSHPAISSYVVLRDIAREALDEDAKE